jgi:hypothetical protein
MIKFCTISAELLFFLLHPKGVVCGIITKMRIIAETVLFRLRTIHSQLYSADLIDGNFYPTRWVGLVCVVLSGRKSSQADSKRFGYNSACDTLNSPLSTINYSPLSLLTNYVILLRILYCFEVVATKEF